MRSKIFRKQLRSVPTVELFSTQLVRKIHGSGGSVYKQQQKKLTKTTSSHLSKESYVQSLTYTQ